MSLIKRFFTAENIPAEQTYNGRGISIAFLDTGVSPVEDFIQPKNRIVAFRDLVNGKNSPYDDNGHGTHVTGLITIKKALSSFEFKAIKNKKPLLCCQRRGFWSSYEIIYCSSR